VCSSGTYVRSLIAALGDAYTQELRRTRVGAFDVADADAGRVIPLAAALAMFRSADLDEQSARRASHGVAVSAPERIAERRPEWDFPGAPEEIVLLDESGPVALAERHEDGTLKPVVGFRA
jgi:tRNA pseudouridine55 synthase